MKAINRILYGEIRDHRWRLVLIAALTLGVVGFDVISPWPFKILIDNVLGSSTTPLVLGGWLSFLEPVVSSRYLLGFLAVLIYFSSTFFLEIATYLQGHVTKHVIKGITADFSKKAFTSLQSLEIGFYKKQQIGDYVYRLGYDVSAIGDFLEIGLLPLVTSGLSLAVTIGIMLLINVPLTLFSCAVLPFLVMGMYFFNGYITHATKRSETLNSAAFSFIEEALTHLKVIQAFSQERRESRRFAGKTETSLTGDTVVYDLDFMVALLVGILIAISYSVVILYGIRAVFAGGLTTGLLIVFIFYLDNLTLPILNIIDGATAAREAHVKIGRMEDFFSKRTHLDYRAGTVKQMKDTTIHFENVSVRDKHRKYILRNATFTIEAGQRVVIMGANGSGKTSIVNLIMRFIEKPSSGHVTIGGVDILSYDLSSLRNAISFVPQEITLFDDTIAKNIAFGAPSSSRRRVRQVARLADADAFVEKLPGGYNFKVGELGEFLSGGQRQRLMLARALMKRDAKIMLFDETLSALDVRGRRVILKNLYEISRGKTLILVSNIFDVMRAADHVIVVNRGRVAYAGPRAGLPHESDLYKMIMSASQEQ